MMINLNNNNNNGSDDEESSVNVLKMTKFNNDNDNDGEKMMKNISLAWHNLRYDFDDNVDNGQQQQQH